MTPDVRVLRENPRRQEMGGIRLYAVCFKRSRRITIIPTFFPTQDSPNAHRTQGWDFSLCSACAYGYMTFRLTNCHSIGWTFPRAGGGSPFVNPFELLLYSPCLGEGVMVLPAGSPRSRNMYRVWHYVKTMRTRHYRGKCSKSQLFYLRGLDGRWRTFPVVSLEYGYSAGSPRQWKYY